MSEDEFVPRMQKFLRLWRRQLERALVEESLSREPSPSAMIRLETAIDTIETVERAIAKEYI